jgi:pyruvate kinase
VRFTKIIATLGPASQDRATIGALVAAGADVFRLNFSHGTHADHHELLKRIREASKEAGRPIGILQDLSGPKVRTGLLGAGRSFELAAGDHLTIATGDFVGGVGRVSTTFAELARSVQAGDRLLLDDGRIELQVKSTDGTEIQTTVVDGGTLGEHKGISAPGVTLAASALTPKDEADLRFGLGIGVDFVAVSFVQTADDLSRVRDIVKTAGREVPIVAKIERPRAVANIGPILDACDAVMVARGDLGLEMPLEHVPRVQKEITREARLRGVPIVVATQVFDSMRLEPRPTRAEVSDAAGAVDDDVDAILLTGETATGNYPVRTVQLLDMVIRDAESAPPIGSALPMPRAVGVEYARALSEAAVTLAVKANAQAIVAATRLGRTARLLASLRPRVPILAATPDESLARTLTLLRGVVPVQVAAGVDLESARAHVLRALLDRKFVADGSVVVYVNTGADLQEAGANFLRLLQISGDP